MADSIATTGEALARNLAIDSANQLLRRDYATLEVRLIQYATIPGVERVRVLDLAGIPVSQVVRTGDAPEVVYDVTPVNLPSLSGRAEVTKNAQVLSLWQPVKAGPKLLGHLNLEMSLGPSVEVQKQLFRTTLAFGMVAVLTGMLLLFIYLRRPLEAIRRASDFAATLDQKRGDHLTVERSAAEFERLGASLNLVSTRLYEQEQAVSASTARLQAVLSHAVDGIITVDGALNVVSFNPAAERLFGYAEKDILGRPAQPLFDAPLHYLIQNRVAAEQTTKLEGRRRDGATFPAELANSQVVLDGETLYIAIVRDITERERFEAALQTSEAEARKLAWVASRTSNAVVISDAEGGTEWVNEGFTRMTGYALKDVIGQKPGHLLQGPDTDPDTVAYIRTQLAKGEGFKVELVNYAKTGRPYWVEIEVQPIYDASGVSHFMAIESDVTERKKTLDALQASEQRFRAVVESLGEGLFITGRDDVVSYANPRVEAITGYAPDEFLGRRAYEILLPKEAHAAAAARNSQRFEGRSEQYEVRCLHKDGHDIWLDNHATPLRDAGGQVIGTLGAFTDVTKRKLAAQELERQRDFAMTVMNTIGQGLTVVDADWRFSYVNPAYARITGYAPDQLIGRSPLEFVAEEDRDRLEAVKTSRLGADITTYESKVRRSDGELVDVLITGVPRFEEDVFVGTISVITDITERKKAEQELKSAKTSAEGANRAKSEFLSRMSHELRTPLNAILGFAQLLELDDLPGDQQESVDRILKAGRHLLDLINEVLDISRIEAGNLSLSLEPVALFNVAQDAVQLIQPLAAEKNIRVELSASLAGEPEVTADLQRLKQVLLNLLSNAVKYNRPGGEVTLRCCSAAAGHLRLEVRDSGPGLHESLLARLFTPFDRLGAEETEVEGSGIGLALTKRLVEAMGGEISVTSEVCAGTSFFVDLPLAAGAQAALPEPPPAVPAVDITPAAQRSIIVYIEDNLSNLVLVEKLLARLHHIELLTAMQGRLGLELVQQQRPDLVLLDLHLPGLGGAEVLERLKADPATCDIPVVILSADATPKQINALTARGALAYLTKPINVQELLGVVEKSLAGVSAP